MLKIDTLAIPWLHVHIASPIESKYYCVSLFLIWKPIQSSYFVAVLKIQDHPILVSLFRA